MLIKVVAFLILASNTSAYSINVNPNEEQCFVADRNITSGTELAFTFVVAGGQLLDIRIIGPDQKDIYKGKQESSGKYSFVADMNGPYTFCFGNQLNSLTIKAVMFAVDIQDPEAQEDHFGEDDQFLHKM